MRRTALAAALAIATAITMWPLARDVIAAQQTGDAVPTFRAGVEAVAYEAFVTDADGKPVTDLTADDFEILENGKPQVVTTFSSVVIPIEPAAGTVDTWPVPSDTATNDQPPGRTYVFLLDEVCAADAVRTRRFLRQFLERYFGPGDIGAVLLAGRGLVRDGQTFTGNKNLLLTAIDKFSGGFAKFGDCKPKVMDPDRERQMDFDTRQRLGTLRDVTESLAAIPGRKTVLYVAMEIDFDFSTVRDYHGESLRPGAADAHAMLSAATRANVVFYPINPMGLTPTYIPIETKADLTVLATYTGGFALQDSNSFMQTFDRVRAESSAYYLLGFNSLYAKHDGRMVRVDVKVKRPGLHVRAREGYLAPLGEPGTRPSGDSSPALAAMASPISTAGVSMKVAATPYRGQIRDAAVALVVEIDPETLALTEQNGTRNGTVEVTYTVTDTAKRAYMGGRHTFPVSLDAKAYDRARDVGLRMISTLALPKGSFELRVAAASGARTGNVVHHFEVPDFTDGNLTMSGLALTTRTMRDTPTLRPPSSPRGTAASKAVKCNPPSCIVPLSKETPSAEEPLASLVDPAVARRVFNSDEELALFVEAYENSRTAAHHVTMTATLESAAHAVHPLASETRDAAGDNRGPSRQAFIVDATLRNIPPGQYLLRVDVRSDASKGAQTSRAVPLEVRAAQSN